MGKNNEILVVTNYFPPEKGAASNRLFSLVENLSKNNYTVSVVCPLPNYPQGKVFKKFKGKFFVENQEFFGKVFRLWLWPSNSSNKFVRMFSMLSFSISLSVFFISRRIPKKVVIQYSPVFVGFTASFWSWFFRKKIILNVSDLWPLAGLEMGLLKKGFYYSILSKMESFCYRKAHLILGQSQEILNHIEKTGLEKQVFLYRNYPEFPAPNLAENSYQDSSINIVYAGLLGVAQGLYRICTEITFSENISLHIFGAGPEAEKIASLEKEYIYFHGEIDRDALHKELQNYQIGFVPLVNRIYGSVPSKIFELSRLGIPVLYFAGGEGEVLVRNNKLGWVLPVNNIDALQNFVDTINNEKLKRFSKKQVQENAVNNFNFTNQFQQLTKEITKL